MIEPRSPGLLAKVIYEKEIGSSHIERERERERGREREGERERERGTITRDILLGK